MQQGIIRECRLYGPNASGRMFRHQNAKGCGIDPILILKGFGRRGVCGWSLWPHRVPGPRQGLLAQLFELNVAVAQRIEKGEGVMPPGMPANFPKLEGVSPEDCIRPPALA
jgi:hypothetical protein